MPQSITPVKLQTAPFTIPRVIGGEAVMLTDINHILHITLPQMQTVLGISVRSIRAHIDNIYQDVDQGFQGYSGSQQFPLPVHLTVYEATVQFQSRTTVGGGGGAQVQKFYPILLVSLVAERMHLTDKRSIVMQEVHDVYTEYQTAGFVVNEQVMRHDPTAVVNLQNHATAYNFSPERWDMVALNKQIDTLFYSCVEGMMGSTPSNRAAHSYFRRCCNNTAHIAAVGMSALQIRAMRANPTSLDFGQHTYRGKNAPQTGELKNACNFLTNYELITRSGVVNSAMGWLMSQMSQTGALPMETVLRTFTMYCSSGPYLGHITSNYQDYPMTALNMIVGMEDTASLRVQTQVAIETYLTNFPNRHSLSHVKAQEYQLAEQELVNASLEMLG